MRGEDFTGVTEAVVIESLDVGIVLITGPCLYEKKDLFRSKSKVSKIVAEAVTIKTLMEEGVINVSNVGKIETEDYPATKLNIVPVRYMKDPSGAKSNEIKTEAPESCSSLG